MTRKSNPDNGFLHFADYKMECDKDLLKHFREACEWYECSMTAVLRELMAEFVEDTRQRVLDDAKLTKEKGLQQ